MINFEDFLREALFPDESLRQGQKLMNMLHMHRPDLYERIMSSQEGTRDQDLYNCFYEDSKIWSTIEWLRTNWRSSRSSRFTDQLEVTGGPTKCGCGKPKITTVKQEGVSWRIGSWCGCKWDGEDTRIFSTRKEAEHALYDARSGADGVAQRFPFNSSLNRE